MTVKIACVAFDCLDALVVGRFWSAAIGRPLDPGASSEFASIGFHGRRDRAGWAPAGRDADPTWLFARVPEPKKGWTGFMVELTYDVPGKHPLKLTSGVKIVPDKTDFEFEPRPPIKK